VNEKLCTTLVTRRAASFDPMLDEFGMVPCEGCGRYPQRLERHHRQFRSRGGVWTPSNVVLLCSECHLAATDEAPWAVASGFNVHSWEEPSEVAVELWYAGSVLLHDDGTFTPAP
jgi:hypothetical protein